MTSTTSTSASPGPRSAAALARQTAHVRESIERGVEHVAAEKRNDAAEIVATVDPRPYFPMIDHDGHGGLTVQLITDIGAVAEYYSDRHTSYEIVESRQVATASTEFYMLRESVATLRGVGDVGGVATGGMEFMVNSAVLFPTTAAGIGGELVYTRYPFGDVVAGRVVAPTPADGPAHLPNDRIAVVDVHDAYLDAWRRNDTAAMASCLSEDCRWERRTRHADEPASARHDSATGREATQALFERWADAMPVEIVVLNRLVSEWYVFADLHVVFEDSAVRHIALHPVGPDGLLRAELGDFIHIDSTDRTDSGGTQ